MSSLAYPNDPQLLTYKKVSHYLTPLKFHATWTHLRIYKCQYLRESMYAILVGQFKIFQKKTPAPPPPKMY